MDILLIVYLCSVAVFIIMSIVEARNNGMNWGDFLLLILAASTPVLNTVFTLIVLGDKVFEKFMTPTYNKFIVNWMIFIKKPVFGEKKTGRTLQELI
jgi:hypothetical protein